MGYQAWLKSSGMGAYLEEMGRASKGKREKGSFLLNRCGDCFRFIFFCAACQKAGGDDDDSDGEGDHTSAGREKRKKKKDEAEARGMLPDSFFSPSSPTASGEGDATQPLLGAAALLSQYVGMAE